MPQIQLSHGQLLDEKGRLVEKGYATSLLRQYDRQRIKAGRLRIKEWDYYLVYNGEFGVALTIDDNSYMGMTSASFLDFQSRREHTASQISLLPLGRTALPATSAAGDVKVRSARCEMSFEHWRTRRRLTCHIARFDGAESLDVQIELFDEPDKSMVIATPFAADPKAFYYNQKIIGMRAEGSVTYRGHNYLFRPDQSFGLLDWGRGVWTYDNTWYWGAAQGLIDGKVFGFNIGRGFGDTSAASENMLFYGGQAHKIETVHFDIPVLASGRDDYLSPWVFTSSDQRLEMTFTPILDRAALTSLGIIMSDQHQVFGYYNGQAILDDGQVITLRQFLGFAEKVHNKW